MTRKTTEGRHRVARAPGGPFTVQLLNDRWFIGEAGAAQWIKDGTALDSWLAANGATGPQDLDFHGDRELEQRFRDELGTDESTSPTTELKGEIT